MKTLPALISTFSIFAMSPTAVAEESIHLPVIEVESPSRAYPQTASTTHLERDDLQRSGQRELTQVLRAIPGLTSTQGMKGGSSGLRLRGSTAGMGLVTIDGIPLYETQPSAISLDLFPAETFGSVDIVRGSAAMLNFGRSLGGNINLHSRDSDKSGAGLHLEGGSFGSLQETAYADWANAEHSLNLTAGRDDSFDGTHFGDPKQGNGERDDSHTHQLVMHLRNRLGERGDLDSSVYYINNDRAVDKLGLVRFPPPEFAIVDDPGRSQQEIWLAQTTAGLDLHPNWRSELQLGYTQHRVNIVIGGVLPG
ncbi:MAG: TonB-dependent receptor plug domain-containing protein, partial [Methylomonas sp.]|nr:TonB-dependent receptor plug domain-containing protein [Methylomonas sp.]